MSKLSNKTIVIITFTLIILGLLLISNDYLKSKKEKAYEKIRISLMTTEDNTPKSVEKEETKEEPTPEPEKVCVDYVIVGNVIPDPAKTDPTPSEKCFNKGTEYDQEKGLTTRQSNCKFNGWYTKSNLTGKWTNGTALNNNLTLYGAWDCGTPVKVPATAAQTPLIILGVGLTAIAIGAGVYIYRNKKLNSNK